MPAGGIERVIAYVRSKQNKEALRKEKQRKNNGKKAKRQMLKGLVLGEHRPIAVIAALPRFRRLILWPRKTGRRNSAYLP